eukprot:scaffold12674_cov123-Isochrysis_galbana.AAC.2
MRLRRRQRRLRPTWRHKGSRARSRVTRMTSEGQRRDGERARRLEGACRDGECWWRAQRWGVLKARA